MVSKRFSWVGEGRGTKQGEERRRKGAGKSVSRLVLWIGKCRRGIGDGYNRGGEEGTGPVRWGESGKVGVEDQASGPR
jgi:hypothetical protein